MSFFPKVIHKELMVGESVIVLGNPFGLTQTVTFGIVGAKGRTNVGINEYVNFIQTDAAINSGNSWGSLVNLRGEIIGANSAIFTRSGGYQGIGFAILIKMAKSIMEDLIKKVRFTGDGWEWASKTSTRISLKLSSWSKPMDH